MLSLRFRSQWTFFIQILFSFCYFLWNLVLRYLNICILTIGTTIFREILLNTGNLSNSHGTKLLFLWLFFSIIGLILNHNQILRLSRASRCYYLKKTAKTVFVEIAKLLLFSVLIIVVFVQGKTTQLFNLMFLWTLICFNELLICHIFDFSFKLLSFCWFYRRTSTPKSSRLFQLVPIINWHFWSIILCVL